MFSWKTQSHHLTHNSAALRVPHFHSVLPLNLTLINTESTQSVTQIIVKLFFLFWMESYWNHCTKLLWLYHLQKPRHCFLVLKILEYHCLSFWEAIALKQVRNMFCLHICCASNVEVLYILGNQWERKISLFHQNYGWPQWILDQIGI